MNVTPPVEVRRSTARLAIAPLIDSDAAELAAITDDPAIIARVDFLATPFGPGEARALIAADAGFHGIRRQTDGALVGLIGAHRRSGPAGTEAVEIGYWIGSRFQRCGYAREALTEMLAALAGAAVFAECHPDNHPSWSLLVSLGFRPAGRAGLRRQRVVLAHAPGA